MSRTMYISRKFQIFPNEQQQKIINDTFGCCRFMWNKLLEKLVNTFFDESTYNKIVNCSDIVLEHPFLDKSNKELIIDRHAVSNEKTFLRKAYSKIFQIYRENKNQWKFRKDGKPTGFPRFKKKTSKQSYVDYHGKNVHIDWNDRLIKIPVVGWTKFSKREKQHPDHWKINNITVSKSSVGKYYVSICYHYEDDRDGLKGVSFFTNPKTELDIIGLDYSSKSLYIDSNGNSADYPKYYRRSLEKMRMLNKKFSRQTKHGKNWEKTRKRLAKLHEHLHNQRMDFLHKLSNLITKSYDVIAVEDLNMRAMSQTLKLGKSTMDNAFGLFRNMLQYKQDRQPFHIVVMVNKWFASSKTCSRCGFIKRDLQLSDRMYECPSCGFVIDRDTNAAINLRNEALRTINTWSMRTFVCALHNHS